MRVFQANLFLPVPPDFARSVRLSKRQGSLVVIIFLILHLLGSHAFGEEYGPQDGASPPSTWEWVKGCRDGDALYLDMRSLHLDHTGEFGDKSANENNQLLGIQVYGFDAGTFVNSHRERSYFLGLSRTIYTKGLGRDTNMDFGYKVGALYGYGKDLPNIGGFCPLIFPPLPLPTKGWALNSVPLQ